MNYGGNMTKLIDLFSKYESKSAFFYDLDNIDEKINSLNNIHNKLKVYYSMKANPNIQLVDYIKDRVNGLEVCSVNELRIALLVGCKNIIFVGPGKTYEEIALCIENEIDYIVLESLK